MIKTINPATGKILKSYPEMDDNTVSHIIDATYEDYLIWQSMPINERANKVMQVAKLLENHKQSFAKIMAEEMGKPITAGIGEIEKCAWVCKYYAKNSQQFLKPHLIETELKKSYVTYQPNGVILAIMPWNFPFWQVFRFAAPNLMAGHGCILKHASISTGAALAIEQLFQQAGLPHNIFRSLIINNEAVAKVIAHPKIVGITLTGSERAGAAVASAAGQALKKVVLELGGSDPYIILKDADLQQAAEACVASRLLNSGQVCIAAKRLIVAQEIVEDFTALVLEKVKHYKTGDPLQETTQLGPLARQDLREGVHKQVTASVKQGAKLLCGGDMPEGPGFYYPPTVLSEVTPNMTAFTEEVFGPVIALTQANDENEAVALANQSYFGLGAAIFTQNIPLAEKLATEKIDAGSVAINTFVKSDPRLPFGGIKRSGFGRELAIEGLHAFMNIKTIAIA